MATQGLLTYQVRGDDVGMRVDVLIAEVGLLPSRAMAQKLIERNCVRVNGQTVTKRYRACSGDRVTVEVPPSESSDLIPEDIALDIRFEDESLIVLSKAAGMVVHPAHGHWSGTLVHALLGYSDALGTLQGDERPGIVHRLDKDTSGLMIVAKNDDTQRALQSMIQQRLVERRYVTLVHGRVVPDTGLIDAPIGRHPKEPKKMWVSDAAGARQAVTSFQTLERFESDGLDDGYSLLECKLQTGRTHQIRVHCAYIKHPVVGDPMYGRRKLREDLGLTRQFLHSYRLAFDHPVTGEWVALADGLPADLATALRSIADRSAGRTAFGEDAMPILLPHAGDASD
jgi:23S rRNA pseudouridine1911/1915/1917 synthase